MQKLLFVESFTKDIFLKKYQIKEEFYKRLFSEEKNNNLLTNLEDQIILNKLIDVSTIKPVIFSIRYKKKEIIRMTIDSSFITKRSYRYPVSVEIKNRELLKIPCETKVYLNSTFEAFEWITLFLYCMNFFEEIKKLQITLK